MTKLDLAFIALVCLVILGIALCARAARPATDDMRPARAAYLICEGRCLQGLTLGPKAQLITPMIDGKPDRSHAVMRGTIVKYDPNLEKLELR